MLAKKTGWNIDYILWEIPLSLICQANHVWYWLNGIKVKALDGKTTIKDKKQIASLIGINI